MREEQLRQAHARTAPSVDTGIREHRGRPSRQLSVAKVVAAGLRSCLRLCLPRIQLQGQASSASPCSTVRSRNNPHTYPLTCRRLHRSRPAIERHTNFPVGQKQSTISHQPALPPSAPPCARHKLPQNSRLPPAACRLASSSPCSCVVSRPLDHRCRRRRRRSPACSALMGSLNLVEPVCSWL